MRFKGIVLAAVLAASLGWMAPASANQSDSRLGPLFEQLKKTSSDGEAEVIESRIWEIWTEPPGGGEDVAALMTRGMLALAIDDYPTALAAFDEVVEKQPEFAEAWNKRATVHFLLDDIPRSIADIRQVLALEPRHFGALSGLGAIFMALDESARALKVFEAALAINPHLGSVKERVEEIRQELAGSPT